MNIPNRLTALAADIDDALNREAANHAEWIEIKLDLCRLFAEVRAEFPSDTAFGHWGDEHTPTINKNDRTGYAVMGTRLTEARKILEMTKLTSIQNIYAKECGWRSTRSSGPTRHNTPKPARAREKATHAIERREQAGEPVTREAIVEEAGVSRGVADSALAAHHAKASADYSEDIVLSMSAEERFQAKVRAFRKNFDYEVETKARAMHQQWYEESMKHWNERLTKFERQLAFRPGVMKAAEYRTLMLCCHPDTAPNASEAKRNEATRILTEYRLKLMSENEDQFVSKHGMPRTREELEQARAEVRARNSARSKAAHAARKAQKAAQA
jgi:hypothetical protein